MKRKNIICVMIAIACSAVAFSRPLQREHIPANAQWVVHVDLDAFRSSTLGTLLLQNIPDKEHVKIDAMTQLLGTDMTKDVHGITLYGIGPGEDNATALFTGKFNKQKLLALLALNETYTQGEYDSHTLHYWTDDKSDKKQVGTFASDTMILISQKESCILSALDVLDGRIESLAGKAESPLYSMTAGGSNSILLAAAEGVGALTQENQQAAILKNSKNLSLACSEADGNMTLDVHLQVQDEVAATNVEQVIRGMMAFAAIAQQEHPELSKLLNTIVLTREANNLNLHLQYPSEKLYEIAKKHDTAIKLKMKHEHNANAEE